MPCLFFILGATGDLTARYRLPAMARLLASGQLSPAPRIVGVARERWDTTRFRRHAEQALRQHAPEVSGAVVQQLLGGLEYRPADVANPGALAGALDTGGAPAIVYLALPPALAEPVIRVLADRPMPEGSRIVIEKPFGTDLTSARALNRLLGERFPEEMLFRTDHILGEETVLNLLGLRFANRILEPVWNREHVQRVEITWDETLALEGRAAYYDRAGALRDMVQNHLLQILSLVAMEPPGSLDDRDLRDRKVELLRAVRKLDRAEVRQRTVRGRYSAGTVGDRSVLAYVAEPGVDASRETETFAEVSLQIDNWRWAGVPFVLRSGKALASDRREIVIHFRPVSHLVFGPHSRPTPNLLRIELGAHRMSLLTNISDRRRQFELEPVMLDANLGADPMPAYERLLLDIVRGDVTLAIRPDEAEEAWRIVEPILEAWRAGEPPLHEYPAGGPPPAL